MAKAKKKSRDRLASIGTKRGGNGAFLFVYGTLMPGETSHHLLKRSQDVELVGAARIRGELYEFRSLDYPGAVPTKRPDRFVNGQLYRLRRPDSTLKILDEFEGCEEGLFRRSLVDVWLDGGKLKAWTYFYARPLKHAELVPTGAYRSA